MNARADIVTSIRVTRHEYGCGYSMRIEYTMEFGYSNGNKPVVARRISNRALNVNLKKFGASDKQIFGCAWMGGTLLRDIETLEVAPNEKTQAGWTERAEWDVAFASWMSRK